MFFGNRFALDLFSLSCPRQESESRASFFGAYDGPYVYAMFEIKESEMTDSSEKLLSTQHREDEEIWVRML
jgi:hypothetical protein